MLIGIYELKKTITFYNKQRQVIYTQTFPESISDFDDNIELINDMLQKMSKVDYVQFLKSYCDYDDIEFLKTFAKVVQANWTNETDFLKYDTISDFFENLDVNFIIDSLGGYYEDEEKPTAIRIDTYFSDEVTEKEIPIENEEEADFFIVTLISQEEEEQCFQEEVNSHIICLDALEISGAINKYRDVDEKIRIEAGFFNKLFH